MSFLETLDAEIVALERDIIALSARLRHAQHLRAAYGSEATDKPLPVGRLPNNTVTPGIEGLLRDSPSGLKTAEIINLTGFKPNSVRGTLWKLRHDGLAETRNGRWYAGPVVVKVAKEETDRA